MIDLFKNSKFLTSKQNTILSAASVITVMIVLAQFFGLVRQWTILRFLGKENFSLFMAAFRLPDLVFEVFAFGAFSAAFIPVLSKYVKKDRKIAWDIAARVANIGILMFLVFAVIFGLYSYKFYSVFAPGFSEEQTRLVASIAKWIFFAQGFFVVSYVITGVLESSRRFLVPALAPIFYNLGIIVGTLVFSEPLGIFAPALGVVIGAFTHLMVQLPVAYKLGFRFLPEILPNSGVKQIGKLALPRFVDLGVLQLQKTGELFFSSLISTASYAYLNLALSLQAVPIMLFGVSLAKASLVSLSHEENIDKFKGILTTTLNQMMFIILPISLFFIVLRVPIVRLTYGTSQSLDWDATLQIGLMLSYYALGVPFQAALALISRAFYARADTKTPVLLSIIDVAATLILETIFVLVLHLPIWSIALANTLGVILQVSGLYLILNKRVEFGILRPLKSTLRSLVFSGIAASLMYFTLKIFDRSVWVKSLSFIGNSAATRSLPFESFVLDTRYTVNLLILTIMVGLLGTMVYLFLSWLVRSQELFAFARLFTKKKAPLELPTEAVTEMEGEG